MKKLITVVTLFLIVTLATFSKAETTISLDELTIKNVSQPYDNIVSGGQPSLDDLKLLKQRGVTNIVNLRSAGEFDGFNEAEQAKALGLNYISLEISGASGVTLENAKKFEGILKQLKGDTLVHCASGNRVGALFALKAGALEGKSVEDAIAEGKKSGLRSLEEKTRAELERSKTNVKQ